MASADNLVGPGAAATAFAALSPSTIDPSVRSRLLALGLPVERIGVIEEVRGTVTVAGYGELRSTHQGDAILPTDALVLSSDSMLSLRLDDGGRLILDGRTRLQLEGLQYLDPNRSTSLKLSLMEGRLLVLPGGDEQGKILLETPHALTHVRAALVASTSPTGGDDLTRLAAAGKGSQVDVVVDGDTPPIALDQGLDHVHIGSGGAGRAVLDRLAENDPRLDLPRQLGLIRELDILDPASNEADLDTSAGGELAAIGPIVVTRPVAAFDLSPEPAPLAEAALGDFASARTADLATRSHLADVLFGPQGFLEDDLVAPGTVFPNAPSDPSAEILLRAWDPGRTWKAIGEAIEPLGNVELDWQSFRRISSRDGPMAQLSAATMSVPEIEQFLGLTGGRLDSLDANSTPSSGTAMRCLDSIRLEAGQSIWFDVFFDSPTDANQFGSQRINDFAVFTSSVGGNTTAVRFADAISAGPGGASGWQSLRYTAGVGGDYVFGFAVLNDGYGGGASRLFVDSVRSADTSGFNFIERGSTVDALGGALQVLAAAPFAVADEFYALADQPLLLNILANDRDPDPFDAIRLVGVDTAGTRGTVRIASGQLPVYSANGKFDILSAGQVGTDTFRYVIDGGNGIQATGTVTVRVVGVNDGPTVRTDWAVANEGGAFVLVAALTNDDDIDLDDGPSNLRIVFAQSANGATTVVPGIAGMGFFYHSGAAFDWLAVGETAIDTVTYTVIDRHGAPSSGLVYVTVNGSNDAPLAAGDTATGDEDAPAFVNVVGNDRDPDISDMLRVASNNGVRITPGSPVVLPSGAVVSIAGDGSLRYDPAGRFDHLAAGQSAADGFAYTVTDDHGGSAEARVSVTLTGRNDGPRPNNDAVLVDEDGRGLSLSVFHPPRQRPGPGYRRSTHSCECLRSGRHLRRIILLL